MTQEQTQNPAAKITVTWDDLQTRKVDQRLKEQDALARNRSYAAMDETMVEPVSTAEDSVGGFTALWRNGIFALALFGLIGALLAWGCGALLEFKAGLMADAQQRMADLNKLDQRQKEGRFDPQIAAQARRATEEDGKANNPIFAILIQPVPHEVEADQWMQKIEEIDAKKAKGQLSAKDAAKARAEAIAAGRNANPLIAARFDPKEAETDDQLDESDRKRINQEKDQREDNVRKFINQEKDQMIQPLVNQDRMRELIYNILAYGVRGVIIAVLLAIAIPLTESNMQAVIINGSVGAALGLLGGVAAAFVTSWIQQAAAGSAPDSAQQFLATVAIWGAMGIFLTLAPGVVMRNAKKLVIGLTGGLIGGLVGGVLFEPIRGLDFTDNSAHFPELVAMIAIGVLAGLATGLIEDAAKTGWVKVVQGLIAGKQFILYRNPTFIGAGPDCQIYLFKDPKVGKRHAAIHIVPGGYELEDLPLGVPTLVNGRPAKRTRLKNGDRVQIGATQLVFMEKRQAAA